MQDINSMLGQEAPTEDQDTNPLEDLKKASEDASKPKKKDKQKGDFDPEIIKAMIATGDNTEGLFTPDNPDDDKAEDDPKFAKPDKKAEIKVGTNSNPKGKYMSNFIEDALKNPSDYKVETPRGEMTVAEAMRKGYNPITKRFEKANTAKNIVDRNLKDANEDDKKAIKALMDPKQLQLKGADADAMNLPKDSIMRAQPGAAQPALPPAMGEGEMPQEQPEEPIGEAPQGLEALLGGVK